MYNYIAIAQFQVKSTQLHLLFSIRASLWPMAAL